MALKISVALAHASEAERLRTAALRFAETRHGPPPYVRVFGKAQAEVECGSDQAAADFDRFWRRFRAETMVWSGFRDV